MLLVTWAQNNLACEKTVKSLGLRWASLGQPVRQSVYKGGQSRKNICFRLYDHADLSEHVTEGVIIFVYKVVRDDLRHIILGPLVMQM